MIQIRQGHKTFTIELTRCQWSHDPWWHSLWSWLDLWSYCDRRLQTIWFRLFHPKWHFRWLNCPCSSKQNENSQISVPCSGQKLPQLIKIILLMDASNHDLIRAIRNHFNDSIRKNPLKQSKERNYKNMTTIF